MKEEEEEEKQQKEEKQEQEKEDIISVFVINRRTDRDMSQGKKIIKKKKVKVPVSGSNPRLLIQNPAIYYVNE